jgi:hypothetical protein
VEVRVQRHDDAIFFAGEGEDRGIWRSGEPDIRGVHSLDPALAQTLHRATRETLCKGRAFCPSCGGRRMADTAAHLVDRVLPEVPVRQWVLSLPWQLRYWLAYDAPLVQEVLGIFVRAVFASLRRRARSHWGIARSQGGAVTFVQRFGDALNLNVHFHSLVLDGVYARTPEGRLRFHVLPPPEDAEVVRVATQVARRIQRLLERRGLADGADPDRLAEEEPLLAALYAASAGGRVATGERAGQRVRRLGDRIDVDDLEVLEGARCFVCDDRVGRGGGYPSAAHRSATEP